MTAPLIPLSDNAPWAGAEAVHGALGMSSLFALMAEQGIPLEAVLSDTGLTVQQLASGQLSISPQQKVAIFRNIQTLSPDPGIALRAGQQLRFSDFGVYGYALLSCATMGEAVAFGVQHVALAGPALAKEFRVEGGEAISTGRDVLALGPLLMPITEFWFSAIQSLICKIIEQPFHPLSLQLPYPRPAHAALYEEVFGCPVFFDAPTLQMRFDAGLLPLPLPHANPMTAELCTRFCQRMLQTLNDRPEQDILRRIRQQFLKTPGEYPGLSRMAECLHMTERTLQRHLATAGTSYHQVVDDMRQRLAVEFLENTNLNIEEIALRVGFSDASNFRKAFKKWTGKLPSHYRPEVANATS